jgi:hypothetical protein
MEITNFVKKIFEKKITEEVHNAFTRYSMGEFVKEPFTVKSREKELTVQGGFEYLNFLHKFLAENFKGEVEIEGVIETVKDLTPQLNKLGLKFTAEQRFGKSGSKFVLDKQKISSANYKKLVEELFGEYLLFNVSFSGGQLKVKSKTTPKLGSPTEKFVTVKMPLELFPALKEDYLFDLSPLEKSSFKDLTVEQTYYIDKIELDEKLLAQDSNLARKKALRQGSISRKVTIDGKMIKDYKINFRV